jgi:hypothetical protein
MPELIGTPPPPPPPPPPPSAPPPPLSLPITEQTLAYSAAGGYYIRTDNTLWWWGDGRTQKVMDDVAAVSARAGRTLAVAIKTDGTLWEWDATPLWEWDALLNQNRRTYSLTAPAKVMDGVAAVSVGTRHIAAVKADGTLWTWGFDGTLLAPDPFYSETMVAASVSAPELRLHNVIAASAGQAFTLAITSDGNLWAFGSNGSGRLGIGNENTHITPGFGYNTDVPQLVMRGVASVSAGNEHGAAVGTDGSLWTWGCNNSGQLGDGDGGTGRHRNAPIKVIDSGVASVTAGYQHTFVLMSDGALRFHMFTVSLRYIREESNIAVVAAPYSGPNNILPVITRDGTLMTLGSNIHPNFIMRPISTPTPAPSPTPPAQNIERGITGLLDGSPMTFDVPPRIINGSTMVPMRAIFNALGAGVSWDGTARTVTATRGSDVIVLTIGASTATFNGVSRPLNQPAVIVGGSTLVPLRFVSEALGADVRWDGATQTVTITSR